jgi:hypothetical protein
LTTDPAAGSAKKDFLSSLLAVAHQVSTSPGDLNTEFRQTLIAFGSATDDNTSALDRVMVREIGTGAGRPRTIGLALGPDRVPLADVLNAAEGSDIPAAVRDEFPELAQADWDAVLRVATLVFSALESGPVPTDPVE